MPLVVVPGGKKTRKKVSFHFCANSKNQLQKIIDVIRGYKNKTANRL